MTFVDGEAARALGELARERWKPANGEELEPPPPVSPLWREGLAPTLEHVDVGISRRAPAYAGREGIYEIEARYLAVIRAAKRTLYIESQYFASRTIAEAMAERLQEPDGPEIVIVNRNSARGWLEEEVMGSSWARLLRLIQEADWHRRFHLDPAAEGGTPIYVHAKALIMDDRLPRVGSSNLNNRSMGFDTECDLAVEVRPGCADEAQLRQRVVKLRWNLLGVPPGAVEGAVAHAGGSLIGALEMLRSEGRPLVSFESPELGTVEEEVLA